MGTLSTPDVPERRTLRDLTLPARLVLAAFLISVGIGYFSALVQLHFQQAPPGEPLPGPDHVVASYHGQAPMSTLERIITTPEHMPFTSSGSMRSAFTTRSNRWEGKIAERAQVKYAREKYAREKPAREKYAREKNAKFDDLPEEERIKLLAAFDELPKEEQETRLRGFDDLPETVRNSLLAAYDELTEEERSNLIDTFDALPAKTQRSYLDPSTKAIREERDGEVAVLVHWIRHGLDKKSYDKDAYALPEEMKDTPITEDYVKTLPDGSKTVRIRKMLENRCVRCHSEAAPGPAAEIPLDTYLRVKVYTKPDNHGSGMGLKKLAQSTHVHLLGFSMLYGLTGLIFAFTSYPALIRLVIAPAALLAQIVDISFWWLARLPSPQGPEFAKAIIISGGIVGLSLAAQILLSLFNMFGWMGRMILILGILASAGGGYFAKDHVLNYLEKEKDAPARVN